MDLSTIEQYAPWVLIILVIIWQNNIFVRPEALERKHRELSEEVDKKLDTLEAKVQQKYVEINAYKEFQNHIYSKLDELAEQNADIKAILMKRRKDD